MNERDKHRIPITGVILIAGISKYFNKPKEDMLMSKQVKPLIYNPSSGAKLRRPILAAEYREMNPRLKWFYNPWTGKARVSELIELDHTGVTLTP